MSLHIAPSGGLHIAFSGGAHGESYELMIAAAEVLRASDGPEPKTLPDAQEWVEALTGAKEAVTGDLDWLLLWAAFIRRMWQFQAYSEGHRIVLSESCALDEASYAVQWMAYQAKLVQAVPKIKLPDGADAPTKEDGFLNRTGATAQVLFNLAQQEIHTFWDFIYYKPMASAFQPENVLEAWRSSKVQQIGHFVKQVPSFVDIITLPVDLEEAKEVLAGELSKWLQTLESGSKPLVWPTSPE